VRALLAAAAEEEQAAVVLLGEEGQRAGVLEGVDCDEAGMSALGLRGSQGPGAYRDSSSGSAWRASVSGRTGRRGHLGSVVGYQHSGRSWS
jgi:hypothetical protein